MGLRRRRPLSVEELEARRLFALAVTPYNPTNPLTELTGALVLGGSGITVTGSTYAGGIGHGGRFTGLNLTSNGHTLSQDDGILLTTGLANNALGPNDSAGISHAWAATGDSDVGALVGGAATADANVLTIDFTADPGVQSISFDLVFASDEFAEYVGVNDTFGAFLDGVHISADGSGNPVTVSNNYFLLNNSGAPVTGKYPVSMGVEYDGFTRSLHVVAPLDPLVSTHTLKFAIADVGDDTIDSGVFLSRVAGSTASAPAPATTDPDAPTGASMSFASIGTAVSNAAGTVDVTFIRSGNTSGAAAVNYFTTNGTAIAGTDYTAKSGGVAFDLGETIKTVTFIIADRPSAPATTQFTITLWAPSAGAYLGTTTQHTVTLQNDRAPVAISSAAHAATTDDTSIDVTVTRTGNTTIPVTVAYSTANGTATAGADYTATMGTLAFDPGQTSKTITVPLSRNRAAANGVQFTLGLSSPTDGALLNGLTSTTVTISNPYAPVQFDAATYTATTDDTGVTVNVTRTGNTAVAASMNYATANGTATTTVDYMAASGTLSFAAGEVSKSITVPLLGNVEAPGDRAFTVVLSNPGGAAVAGPVTTATVTVQNPYSPVRVGAAGYTVSTDDATATVTVVRTGNVSLPGTVGFETADITALAGEDYTARTGVLSFAAGETSKTIAVTLGNNHQAADGVTFSVALADTTGAALVEGSSSTIVTIQNAHAPLQLSAATYATNTDATSVSLTVARTGNTALAVTVNYATSDGSAAAGTDYTTRSGTLSFAAGEMFRTIIVPILGNAAAADGAAFTVTLSGATGGGEVATPGAATVSIANNYSEVRLGAATYAATVQGGTATVTVTRAGNTALAASVDYATADGTGAAGVDYAAASGTLNFAAGEVSKNIAVPLLGNAGSAATATFTLSLSNPGAATVVGAQDQATVTVTNTQSLVQFAPSSYTVAGDDGTVTLTVTRTGNTTLPVTVGYATADGTAVAGVDYTAAAGTVSLTAGQTSKTFTVPVRVNAAGAVSSEFTVALASPAGGAVIGASSQATVTVQNLRSLVEFETTAVTAVRHQGPAVLVVRRTGNVSLAASVSYVTVAGTATDGTDFTLASGVVNFAPGQITGTISVVLKPNAKAPPSRSFTVSLTAAGGNGVLGSATTATVTVVNRQSEVQFAGAAYVVAENGGAITLTLTREGNLDVPVDVNYSVAGGTATAGADFTGAAGTVSFAPGQGSVTFDVAVQSDLVVDPNETVVLSVGEAAGDMVPGAQAMATLTITDTTPAAKLAASSLGLSGRGLVDGVSLTFDQALQAAPDVSAFALYRRSAERPGVAPRQLSVALQGVSYDPATHAVTVRPTRALKSGVFYQLVVNPEGVRNEAGRPLDGASTGEGSPLLLTFAHGKKLKYVDSNGDMVQLRLRGPGTLQLTRRSDGEAERVTILGSTPLTVLSGLVTRSRAGGDGRTGIGSIVGLGAGTNLLSPDLFDVGSVA